MELRQLRHFLALVEERSITRAAKRELIVQSGLSNSIQALERELGTPLYVRGTRPVRLSHRGWRGFGGRGSPDLDQRRAGGTGRTKPVMCASACRSPLSI
jgi:hypothetical protein